MDGFKRFAEPVSLAIDLAGVLVIVLGLLVALARFVHRRHAQPAMDTYRHLRHDVGRAILLGLEFMVAGDIIRTVAIEPTMDSVLVLGMIVLIRTFLSISLEVELEGRWPWRRHDRADTRAS